MSRELSKKEQVEKYNMLGDLTMDEYVAMKAYLGQNTLHVDNLKMDQIYRVDGFGNREKIEFDQIQKGDTIRITGDFGKITGGTQKHGTIQVENVKDCQFDPETGELLFDSDKFCITSCDNVGKTAKTISTILENPDCWLDKKSLSEATRDMTFSDYKEIRDLMNRENERDYDFYNTSLDDIIEEEYEEELEEDLELDLEQELKGTFG